MPGGRAKERENKQVVFRIRGGQHIQVIAEKVTFPVGIPSDVTVRLAVGTVALAVRDAFFQTVTGTFFDPQSKSLLRQSRNELPC